MDKEKLNKAAEEYARECWDAGNHHRIAAFKDGAQWLMQQPLSERLTDEEKEKIMQVYRYASCPSNRATYTGQTVLRLFPSIFGSELFKQNENETSDTHRNSEPPTD